MATVTVIRWKLRSLMADRKMKATQLAKLMDVSRTTIEDWKRVDEMPAFKNPSATLDALCQHLNCSLSDLLEREGDRHE